MSEEDAITTPELSAQSACKNVKKAERRIWLYMLIQCVTATGRWVGYEEVTDLDRVQYINRKH